MQQNFLQVLTDVNAAIQQACRKNVVGVLNTYQIDLNTVSINTPKQLSLDNYEGFDIVIPTEPTSQCILLCSDNGLKSLQFIGATFVTD